MEGEAAGADLVAAFTSDVVTLHGANGDVLLAGGAVRQLLGAEPRALNGAGLFGYVHVADRPAFLTTLARALNGSETSTEVRLRTFDADTAPVFIWASMHARPRRAGEAACRFTDISALKQSEEEAEAFRTAAPDHKLQRLLAKAAEQIARELQAAHRSLALGSIDAVGWRRTSTDTCSLLERCRSDAARLRSVLEFDAGPVTTRGISTFEATLQRCVEDVSTEAGTRRQIVLDCASALARTLWPSDSGSAALCLLLHEALSRAGGEQPLRLAAAREGGEFVLRLSFDSPVGGGGGVEDKMTAVWLALAQQLVEPSGGSVRRESRIGLERFTLRLPAAEGGTSDAAEATASVTAVSPLLAKASG